MLHSDWLLNMLEKSGTDPRSRTLALFDILHDWSTAPGLQPDAAKINCASGSADALLAYLTTQLTALRLAEPEVLAQQVHCIALGAWQAEMSGSCTGAFAQGKHAVAVLLDAQRTPAIARAKVAAMAASVCLIALSAAFVSSDRTAPPQPPAAVATAPAAMTTALTAPHPARSHQGNSPDQLASLHDSLERIRQGVCQYPQALMLAPEYRAVYLENVVNGSVPDSANQMREAHRLAQQVECYYPPVAMTAM